MLRERPGLQKQTWELSARRALITAPRGDGIARGGCRVRRGCPSEWDAGSPLPGAAWQLRLRSYSAEEQGGVSPGSEGNLSAFFWVACVMGQVVFKG